MASFSFPSSQRISPRCVRASGSSGRADNRRSTSSQAVELAEQVHCRGALGNDESARADEVPGHDAAAGLVRVGRSAGVQVDGDDLGTAQGQVVFVPAEEPRAARSAPRRELNEPAIPGGRAVGELQRPHAPPAGHHDVPPVNAGHEQPVLPLAPRDGPSISFNSGPPRSRRA